MPGRRCRLLSLWEMVGDISETTQSPVYGARPEAGVLDQSSPRSKAAALDQGLGGSLPGGRTRGDCSLFCSTDPDSPAGGPGEAWVAVSRSRFREFAGAPVAAAPGSRLAERAVALRWWPARNCGGTRTPACPPLPRQPEPYSADTGGTG